MTENIAGMSLFYYNNESGFSMLRVKVKNHGDLMQTSTEYVQDNNRYGLQFFKAKLL